MGKTFDHITPEMSTFIERQHLFFVATAPTGDGRVNLSPKGYDTFRVIDAERVAYLDLTGSGIETVAHLQENGRITFMFCAFEGEPVILRLYGTGRVVQPNESEFAELRASFGSFGGVRAIIVADIDRTSTSCGWAVPFMEYSSERSKLADDFLVKGDDELVAYRSSKNRESIDGLRALDV